MMLVLQQYQRTLTFWLVGERKSIVKRDQKRAARWVTDNPKKVTTGYYDLVLTDGKHVVDAVIDIA